MRDVFPEQKKKSEMNKKEYIFRELRKIPGVGKEIASDLWDMGFRSLRELERQYPEILYKQLGLDPIDEIS